MGHAFVMLGGPDRPDKSDMAFRLLSVAAKPYAGRACSGLSVFTAFYPIRAFALIRGSTE